MMIMRQEINISNFISRYFYQDLIHNLEDSTFCLNPLIAQVTKSIWTWLTSVFCYPGVSYYID